MMKPKLAVFLAAALLLTAILPEFSGFAESNEKYIPINLTLDSAPLALFPNSVQDVEENRTLVPIRPFCAAAGMVLKWNDADWSFVIKKDGQTLRFQIGNSTMYKGETPTEASAVPLDAAPRLLNDRSFVPVRALSEGMGYSVQWNERTKTVSLTSPAAEQAPAPTGTEIPLAEIDPLARSLYVQMPKDNNYMISPFSLKTAFAMAAEGAEGTTKEEILTAMRIDDLAAFRQEFSALVNNYENCSQLPKQSRGEFNCKIANSIWLNRQYLAEHGLPGDLDFSADYKKQIAEAYHGTSQAINGKNGFETINDWISEQTKGAVPRVLEKNDFLCTLVNTLYLKAEWAAKFDEKLTSPASFTQRDGKEAEVSMMHQTDAFYYYADEQMQAVRLPYSYAVSMYVVLAEENVCPTDFLAYIPRMKLRLVNLSLPKFKTESNFDLNSTAKDMGITASFSPNTADFSLLLNKPEYSCWIDQILQRTLIDLDENGTSAAAATTILLDGAAAPPSQEPEKPVDFTADRPFTYFICDNATNEVLFMGEYAFVE